MGAKICFPFCYTFVDETNVMLARVFKGFLQ